MQKELLILEDVIAKFNMRQKAEFQRFSQQVSQCKEISKELDISRMECVDRLQVVQKNLGIQTDPMASFMLPLD